MMRLEDALQASPGFEFPTHFCLAGAAGQSLVCFQNFYDQIFRDTDVPVELQLFGFDPGGKQVGAFAQRLATGESVQIAADRELGMREPGLIAVAALPRFDLQRLAQGRLRVKPRVGTGFYMIWQDRAGHVDTMHEWLAASPRALRRQTFYVVFDHAAGRIGRYGLVLMSPVLDRAAIATARLALYTRTGRTLATAELPPLGAMGSRIVYLDEVFAPFGELLAQHGVLGVRVEARNLVEPFSLELQRSGDFHIHHIN
jgi:hypothetical protein